jgi:hypothetical protein
MWHLTSVNARQILLLGQIGSDGEAMHLAR